MYYMLITVFLAALIGAVAVGFALACRLPERGE